MTAGVDSMRARMRPLPARLRIAHLAALLRWERAANARAFSSISLPVAGRAIEYGSLVPEDAARPYGSRRAASGAPHHEGPGSRHELRPHPEEHAKGGRLEGWAAKRPLTAFGCACDRSPRKEEGSDLSHGSLRDGPLG